MNSIRKTENHFFHLSKTIENLLILTFMSEAKIEPLVRFLYHKIELEG